MLRYIRPVKHFISPFGVAGRHRSTSAATQTLDSPEVTTRSYAGAKPFHMIPGPRSLPFIGSSYLYRIGPYKIEKYHDALIDLRRRYGPVIRQNFAGQEVIFVYDLEDVKTVLYQMGKAPVIPSIQDGSRTYRLKKNYSLGLGNLNGDDWYVMRAAVQQMMLKPREVEHHLPKVDAVTVNFMKRLEVRREADGSVSDLHNEVSKWFLETAGEILYEERLGCMDGGNTENDAQKWITANRQIFYYNAILKFQTKIYKYISSRPWRRLVKAEDDFHHLSDVHLAKTIKKIRDLTLEGKLKDDQYNYLAFMLSRPEISDGDLEFFANSLISDGLATVPSSYVYNLYNLAKNPGVQEQLYQEVSKSIPKEGPITVDMLTHLPYLKATVKETFRTFPLGLEVSRVLQKDMVIGGYQVPAGTLVDLVQMLQMKSEKYFPNPLKFSPERWLRGPDATENAFMLTPFGHGTRMCVGRRFALQDLYVIIARTVNKYRVEYPKEEELKQTYNTLLFPDGPVKIKFIPRT